ncbi:MAG: TlpA disulfide reductase family protein [bacterium]|nr:TlpA disulfide reductase family protein [bacterium]MDT8366980.1 TlpA disulfide reductase family protein [bacterium]
MRTIFLSISLLFFAAVPGFCSDVVKPQETRDSSSNGYVSKPVAAFETVTTKGDLLSSQAHGARALLISLWGLNCGSCLDEMKVLEPFYREFKDQGLKIWAVNTEDIGGKEIEEGLRNKGIEVSYDLIPDPGLEITKLFTSWFIPVTLIVDSEGIVQYYKVGFNEADVEKIKAMVGSFLVR